MSRPGTIEKNCFFFLAGAVVSVETHVGLPESVMLKIIMGVADGRIRSFSSRSSLINQKVDLL